jgi:myxalamid-type polyketide synthase MxaE and MxaD
MAMELRNHLEAALGRSLSATLAFNYPTVSALAEFLAGAPAAADAPVTVAPIAEVTALGAEDHGRIAELSDEDAARELRASRSRGTR